MNEVSHYAPTAAVGLESACLIDRSQRRWTALTDINEPIVQAKASAYDVLAEWHHANHPGRLDCCTE